MNNTQSEYRGFFKPFGMTDNRRITGLFWKNPRLASRGASLTGNGERRVGAAGKAAVRPGSKAFYWALGLRGRARRGPGGHKGPAASPAGPEPPGVAGGARGGPVPVPTHPSGRRAPPGPCMAAAAGRGQRVAR